MKFFAPTIAGRAIGERISYSFGEVLNECLISKFSDGEISCEIQETVRGEDCFIIQSICATEDGGINDHLMQVVFMVDALKRASAKTINLVIPYMGYSRQDRRNGKRQSISAKVVASMLSKDVDHVFTMDLHCDQIEGFFDVPVDNLSFKNIIFKELNEKKKNYDNLIIVAPDMGSAHRVHSLAKKIELPMIITDKRRDKPNSISEMTLIGDVRGKVAILIDDLVDTGGTLRKSAELLKKEGACEVIVYATHPVLSGKAHYNLFQKDTPFDEINFSNSIPIVANITEDVSSYKERVSSLYIHDISFIFSKAIKNMWSNRSVSQSIL